MTGQAAKVSSTDAVTPAARYLARGFLRDPYWVLHAAVALGEQASLRVPPQYERGWGALGVFGGLERGVGEPLPAL